MSLGLWVLVSPNRKIPSVWRQGGLSRSGGGLGGAGSGPKSQSSAGGGLARDARAGNGGRTQG